MAAGAEDKENTGYEAASAVDATALDVPTGLFQRARRFLLENQPLRARASAGKTASHALSAGEVDALQSVGLTTDRWDDVGKTDPLAQSIADYMAMLDTSLTTLQAAKHLEVDPSRIRQRLRERSLYGIEYDGEKRLPLFQFEKRRVLPGLAAILAELPRQLSPLDVAEWFLSPDPDLEIENRTEPVSPRKWLLSGRSVERVVALARGFE